MNIGLDILGGDDGPEATTKGAILARKELDDSINLVLIGDEEQIVPILESEGADPKDFQIVHTKEVIGMGEHPAKAFTRKQDSTIGIGFKMLKSKEIDSFASTGNTGAMLVGAVLTVRTVSGVIRPCITTIMPKEDGTVGILLDVGINADCKPDVLYQFGILGSLFASNIYNIKNPKVGLINIGEEDEKGNLLTQATNELMRDCKDFNFIGNIEGQDFFSDKADVMVCDGFTGNVVLKQAESFFSLIKKRKIDDKYFDRFNYELYGGTPVLGINSNVLIGHGRSSALAIKNMLLLSKDTVESKLSEKIKNAFN